MARQNKKNDYVIMLGVGAVLVIAVAAFAFKKNNFDRYPSFPIENYLEGDSSWSDSDYVIKGIFQNILVKQDGDCMLCSITTGDHKVQLPVIFKTGASKRPLQREQRIQVKVKVRDDGGIVASDYIIQ